ncbi:MAG: HAD family hydrolase [Chloroflexi bacterium]|nr:HAD family hydrolase [Chloroflexota bacterium]
MVPRLLALDFDGVLCDGMDEFFESARRGLADVTGKTVPDALHGRFAGLRPAVESGWEMVALIGMLAESDGSEDRALRQARTWATARDRYLASHGLDRRRLTLALDGARDRWIAGNLADWLRSHRFYPGVVRWLTDLTRTELPVYIISTKGKPFLEALLTGQGVHMPPDRVIGKEEPRREKWDVLRDLAQANGVAFADVWFVEDRLPTLLEMRERAPDLRARLFFASWGFVFPERDSAAAREESIPVLDLATMTGPFAAWPSTA